MECTIYFPHYNPRGETYDPPFTNKNQNTQIIQPGESHTQYVMGKNLKLSTLEFKHLDTTVFVLFFSNCPISMFGY